MEVILQYRRLSQPHPRISLEGREKNYPLT
jgi:hypothetical protein